MVLIRGDWSARVSNIFATRKKLDLNISLLLSSLIRPPLIRRVPTEPAVLTQRLCIVTSYTQHASRRNQCLYYALFMSSDHKFSGASSDSDARPIWDSSKQSGASSNLDFVSYDEELLEPLATEQEARDYTEDVEREEEEVTRLSRRFSRESDISTWYLVFFHAFVIF